MANLKGLYINNNKLAPSGGSGAIELMDFLDEPASPYTIYGTNKKYSFLLVYAITKDLTGKFIDVIPIDQVREGNPAIH